MPKPANRVQISSYVLPKIKRKIDATAKTQKISTARWIECVVENALDAEAAEHAR